MTADVNRLPALIAFLLAGAEAMREYCACCHAIDLLVGPQVRTWRLAEEMPCLCAHCPHCITPCQVAEQYLGRPVKCFKCGKAFTVHPTVLASKPPSTEPIPQTAGTLRLEIAGFTSIGRQRSRNEDSFLVQHLTWSDLNQNHQLALVIVADGMGGHAGGEQAARLALRTIATILAPLLMGALNMQQREVTRAGLADSIDAAIKRANNVVLQTAATDKQYKGMGATAAVVVIWNGRVVIGHLWSLTDRYFLIG